MIWLSAFLRLASQPRDPVSWSALTDMLLRTRGLAADEPSAMKLGRELTAMITILQAPLTAANTAAELTELIRAMIGFLDAPTFRRLHPQYSQGDFLRRPSAIAREYWRKLANGRRAGQQRSMTFSACTASRS